MNIKLYWRVSKIGQKWSQNPQNGQKTVIFIDFWSFLVKIVIFVIFHEFRGFVRNIDRSKIHDFDL